MKNNYVGATKVMNNGREATIIAFRDFYDVDVMCSTGEIAKHKAYQDFLRCDAVALGFYRKAPDNSPENIKTACSPAFLYETEGGRAE